MGQNAPVGAKVAVMIGARLLVIRRDQKPGILFPGLLDIPGGGIEAGETAHEAALRETWEEVGLRLSPDQLTGARQVPGVTGDIAAFAACLPEQAEGEIVFGDEGQGWCLMLPGDFAEHPEAVPLLAKLVAGFARDGLLGPS